MRLLLPPACSFGIQMRGGRSAAATLNLNVAADAIAALCLALSA